MKRYYKTLLLACLVMGGTTACTDNLEIDQHGVQNYETYYDTDEQIERRCSTATSGAVAASVATTAASSR